MSQPLPFKSALACRNAVIERLLNEVGQQQRLLATIREVLPENLRSHVCHARWDGARLLIHVEAAVWATSLRFYSEMIKNQLHTAFSIEIRQVQVRVLVDAPSMLTPQTLLCPTPRATSIEDADAALQRALQRLEARCAALSRRGADL